MLLLVACGRSGGGEATPTPSAEPSPAGSHTPTPSPETETFGYEVQPDDTLFGLAIRFDTTVEAIMSLNDIADASLITVGQVLLIPGTAPPDVPTASVTAAPSNPAGTGFVFPIESACLPNVDRLMPNAPRTYRAGIHEGVDFYTGHNCVTVVKGTEVLAAKKGRIIRADHAFVEMTAEQLDDAIARSVAQGYTSEDDLNLFRGRQVWIDHGGGIVTRYCHLSGIPSGTRSGAVVEAGVVIGLAGESGTPEAVTAPGTEIHLHFELRVGDSYLGAGLDAGEVRTLYEEVFSGS